VVLPNIAGLAAVTVGAREGKRDRKTRAHTPGLGFKA